jgi:hypothetical protein
MPTDESCGSKAGLSGVQMTIGVPPIPTISGIIGERRCDRFETEHRHALPRNVETGHMQTPMI